MSKSLKIILFALGGFIGLVVIATLALPLLLDLNAYKSQLEAAASEALGMEVRIGDRLEAGFFPGPHVILEDVHIRNRGMEVASAQQASLGIDLFPLLQREVRIGRIALKRPRISIERDHDGKFNFDRPEEPGKRSPALDLGRVSFADGTLSYADKRSAEGGFEAVGCHLDARRLSLAGGEGPDLMQRLSLTAKLACGEIRTKDFTISDLKLSIAGKKGVFDLKPVTLRLFGGQGSGSMRVDFSGAAPLYQVHYSLPQLRLEELIKSLAPEKTAQGSMDFSAHLTMQGKTMDQIKQSVQGEVSLRGDTLTLDGRDLDREFARFESSQNFSLVDAGAFFFAGPFGLAVTKGYDFATLFKGPGGSSTIRTLVSHWKVEGGVAQAQDVAMATKENRIALKGKLDFVHGQFDDVTIALLDAKGCVKVRQKIHGPFRKPAVEQPSVIKSLAGPALNLLKQGRDLFPGGQCDVFYTGSVAPPK